MAQILNALEERLSLIHLFNGERSGSICVIGAFVTIMSCVKLPRVATTAVHAALFRKTS
jgi:hypothetical protein